MIEEPGGTCTYRTIEGLCDGKSVRVADAATGALSVAYGLANETGVLAHVDVSVPAHRVDELRRYLERTKVRCRADVITEGSCPPVMHFLTAPAPLPPEVSDRSKDLRGKIEVELRAGREGDEVLVTGSVRNVTSDDLSVLDAFAMSSLFVDGVESPLWRMAMLNGGWPGSARRLPSDEAVETARRLPLASLVDASRETSALGEPRTHELRLIVGGVSSAPITIERE